MLIKKKSKIEIPSSEITPKHLYLSRRKFMSGAAATAVGATLAACSVPGSEEVAAPQGSAPSEEVDEAAAVVRAETDELGDPLTEYQDIVTYNNFYEFSTNKSAVASLSSEFVTSPWQIEITGMVRNPGIYDMDDIRKSYDIEERIYRLRCVEAWSMVIPWNGFPLSKLVETVEPTSDAKYIRFETLYDPEQMPGQNSRFYDWPYVEGLTIAEAMNDLTLMATGIYGQDLLPQNGAPIRLVVPWKYGFKSIKSIVKIEFTDVMPQSLWMATSPNEYGFYANVNPEVAHPRWSQASERRIGELSRRPTLMFNGYEEQVAYLYEGIDLRENF